MPPKNSSQEKSASKAWKWITITLVIVIAGCAIWYFSDELKNKTILSSSLLSSAEVDQTAVIGEQQSTEDQVSIEAKKEIEKIIQQVGKLILLPVEQEPVIATIQNAEALVNQQAFYHDTKDGDKLLVYSQKAIIYRESENKLINVGPVYFDNEPLSLDIRNGSRVAGLAFQTEEYLAENEIYEIISTTIPVKGYYEGNIVVNLGKKDVSVLAMGLNAEIITEFPAGEAESEADVIIILGEQIENIKLDME